VYEYGVLRIGWVGVMVIALGVACTSRTSTEPLGVPSWPPVSAPSLEADLVLAGTLTQIHESGCVPSGVAVSSQGVSMTIKETLKGESPGSVVTIYYIITGSGPLEVRENDCYQLSPRLLRPGTNLIVSVSHKQWVIKGGGWAVIGGPWPDNDESRATIRTILSR